MKVDGAACFPSSSFLLAAKWRPIPPPRHTHTHTHTQPENEIHARHYTLPFVSETHLLLTELHILRPHPKGEALVTFVGPHCGGVGFL